MSSKHLYLLLPAILIGIQLNAQISFNTNSSFRYLKGKDASDIPSNWMTSNYNISNWSVGNAPFRYADGTGGTELPDMLNSYSTLYLRSTFTAKNIENLGDILLTADYDDGFIIWINGEVVLSENAPETFTNKSFATENHESGTAEYFTLPAQDIHLVEGENTIAIQAFNVSLESSDFLFNFGMSAGILVPEVPDSINVLFSQKSGFYTNNFTLKLDVPDQQYSILYTIDGSNPQTSSTAKKGGQSTTININPSSTAGRPKTPGFVVRASLTKEGLSASKPLTQTYIFLDQVLTQTSPGGGWPTSKYVNDQQIDLEMDTDVTKNAKYASQMKASLTDIPSISLVTDIDNLFNPATGIYVNALLHGDAWERFCSVELIYADTTKGFNVNAGLRIRGGWSRHGNYPKHGFRLFFKEKYGPKKLKYPLFEDEGVSEFDKLDLRCEQNYSWSNGDSRNTCVREVFSRDTQRDMGQPYTRSRYYHLYLNGMYWGLFQSQERSEAGYAESYFGGDKEDYDVIKVNGNGGIKATDGDLNGWTRLFNLAKKGFSSNANYFALEGKNEGGYPVKGKEVLLDIDNLIDYMIVIFYTGNFDAPVTAFGSNTSVNNIYSIFKRDDKTKGFIFFAHDSEHSMMIDAASPGIGIEENRVEIKPAITNATMFNPQTLHARLLDNKEYRQRFIDRAYKHFENNGVLTPDAAQARFEARVAQIDMAIIAESARWGDAQSGSAYTKDNAWLPEIERVYDFFFPYRTDIVIDQLYDDGLYTKLTPVVFKKNGTVLTKELYPSSFCNQITVSTTSTKGEIYMTLDGTDPRTIGGGVNANASKMENGKTVSIDGTTLVKCRVKQGEIWSALSTIAFTNDDEDYTNLKVTEINYNPVDSIIGKDTVDGKSFEFIELKNTGKKPINLSGLKISSSIEYEFKDNELLSPKQFYVIASKPKWFYERYGQVPTANFDKNLSNSGEKVIISNARGNNIISFWYSDSEPWSPLADGKGYTLSSPIRYPTGSPNNFNYWIASSVYNGSPFADDPGIMDANREVELGGNEIAIYPNPTQGKVFFKFDNNDSDVLVEVYTMNGSKIYGSSIQGNGYFDLNLMNVKPGLLLFKISSEGKTAIRKVLYKP